MSDSIFTRKRRSRAWIAVPLVLLPLYLLLFPRPIGREPLLRPIWVLDLRRAAATVGTATEPAALIPFRAGKRFGYVSLDGRLHYSEAIRHQVALSLKGYINYGSRPDHFVFMDPGGEFQFSVQGFGYPLLDPQGEVLYSVNTDLGGIKRIGADGETLWQGEFSSPMTSAALRGEECLIGLLDGRAVLYGPSGETLFAVDPPGSRVPVILATALADTGGMALVSGIDPQQLVLVSGDRFETVRSRELPSDFRREAALDFGPDGRFLYLEQEEGIMVLESETERWGLLPLAGRLRTLAAGREFAAAGSSADDSLAGAATLAVFRPLAVTLARASVQSASLWCRVSGRSLLVGLDDELLRADLVEE